MKGVTLKKIIALSCLSLMMVACAKTTTTNINNTHNTSGGTNSSVYIKLPANAAKNCKIKKSTIDYSASAVSSNTKEANESEDHEVTTANQDHGITHTSTLDDNKNIVETTAEATALEKTPTPEEIVVQPENNISIEPTDQINTESSRSNITNISWHWPDKGNIIEKFTNASKGIDISGLLGDKSLIGDDGKFVYSGNEAAIRSTLLSVSIALDIISSKLPLGINTLYKVIVSNHINFS